MKYFFVAILVFIATISANAERQTCSFLCESIPEDREVLKSLGQYSKNELPDGPLKIVVWNIYKGRKKNFASQFSDLTRNADLILLSETTDGDLVKPALDELNGFGWEMAINFFMKNEVATGVMIGTPAIPAWRQYLRTPDLEPAVKSPKTIVIGKYPLSGHRYLLALSIHGINWSGNDAFERQIKAAEPYIVQHTGPIIFAGDFNTKNSQRQETLVRILAKHGLKRAPWNNPMEKQLDDAFLRGFEIHRAEIDHEVVTNEGSDHPALRLEVTPNL